MSSQSDNSFLLSSMFDDVRTTPLTRLLLWNTSFDFSEWRISLALRTAVRGNRYIHIKLIPRRSATSPFALFANVTTSSTGPRYTEVAFNVSSTLFTVNSRYVNPLLELGFASGVTMNDVLGVMQANMPFYECASDVNGSALRWNCLLVETLESNDLFVETNLAFSDTVRPNVMWCNRQSSSQGKPQIPWPLPQGTIHHNRPSQYM
ncbi:hypothetical protein BDZ97DRAFT_1781712 [Flammula alnicola]|nr:hypothetical protein BDZ97DRAFT_1781712 [Flammula alnicola]